MKKSIPLDEDVETIRSALSLAEDNTVPHVIVEITPIDDEQPNQFIVEIALWKNKHTSTSQKFKISVESV